MLSAGLPASLLGVAPPGGATSSAASGQVASKTAMKKLLIAGILSLIPTFVSIRRTHNWCSLSALELQIRATFLSGNIHAIFDVSLEKTEYQNREARRAEKSDSDGETQAKTETVPLQNKKPSLPD